ncbi:MAG: hypothetical protein JRJ38_07135 [Deltaproteobacteria bacterium]|nr:hypothetical protein [Deltaproteobacteria bacterium]
MKSYSAIIMAMLLIIGVCGSSNNPGGYNDVKWGASIENVKTKFGDIKKTNESIFEITEYEQVTVNSSTIKSRTFTFKENKLVEVQNRLSLDKNTWQLALDKLNEKFGKYQDIKVERTILYGNDESEIISFTWNMPETKIIFRKITTPMREFGVSVLMWYIIYRHRDYVDFLKKQEKKIKKIQKNNMDL